jgi:hypothetical protein
VGVGLADESFGVAFAAAAALRPSATFPLVVEAKWEVNVTMPTTSEASTTNEKAGITAWRLGLSSRSPGMRFCLAYVAENDPSPSRPLLSNPWSRGS